MLQQQWSKNQNGKPCIRFVPVAEIIFNLGKAKTSGLISPSYQILLNRSNTFAGTFHPKKTSCNIFLKTRV
jgi:hypothetical protein